MVGWWVEVGAPPNLKYRWLNTLRGQGWSQDIRAGGWVKWQSPGRVG